MPDYKRKRRGLKPAPRVNKKRIKKEAPQLDIEMHPQDSPAKTQKPMRVVKGKKAQAARRSRVRVLVIGFVGLVLLLCQFLIPAGLVETISTIVSPIGSGSYPLTLESNDTLNTISKGSYYYVLTNGKINAYSNGGKEIFTYTHGFENPVLKTSKTRALVFDQGGNTALIFTLSGLKKEIELKNEIKTASIGDNGTYAFVTDHENFACAVSVYKKNGKSVYEWFSSKDLVNNVAISPNGKKIAVSSFSSNIGQYTSKVSVLNFKSATPENEKNFEDTIVYSLDSSFSGGFSVLTSNSYNFIRWSNFKLKEYKNEYNTAMFRVGNSGSAVVYNRENNKTDNRIAIFNRSGKLKREIEFKGIITDFCLKNGHIYCVSDTKAYVLDNKGKVLRSADCGFGAVRISLIGQNTVALITDNKISKIKLEQE